MHLHEMRDSDNHFIIDPVTMAITNNSAKHTLQQGDHNSEIYTFELPRIIEGHDMTLCHLVEIHYINIKSDKTERSEDVHTVKDMAVSEDDPDTLVFTWKIHGNATMYAGSLNFRIRFGCTDENGAFTYRKHTEIFKGITISEGFDNAESVEADHSDILSQCETRLDILEEHDVAQAEQISKLQTVTAFCIDNSNGEYYTPLFDTPAGTYVLNGKFFLDRYCTTSTSFSNEVVTLTETTGNSKSIYVIRGKELVWWAVTNKTSNEYTEKLETQSNRATTIDEKADDKHYPTAKAVYDYVGNMEAALDSIIAIQESLIGGAAE